MVASSPFLGPSLARSREARFACPNRRACSQANKGCDISKRFPGVTEYFPLTSCHKDIRAHLRTVNVSQTSILTEKDLIPARSGHFEEEGLNTAVCPKHRAELGIFWRPGRKCTHPLHGGRKGRPERGANLQMCKEAMKK